ncbi:MAG: glycosyltransferase family 39 protein [Candidatus Melainabacteria bacterium]|nr:glycosyltransferase family 39 protein [Candidatus Melainabacteria bacterium]
MNDSTQRNPQTAITVLLWSLIGLGIILRLVNPFFSNPVDFLESDPLRHFLNARECLRTGADISVVYDILDPLGYQIWLSSVLRITGGDRTALALYAGGLSVLTTWLWYRWMRLAVGNRVLALTGYAILSLLPDWIRVNQFFLQETLILPLLGLSLWLSWITMRRPTMPMYISTGVAWGCALLTKVTVLPMALILAGWILWKTASDRSKLKLPLIAIATTLLIYSLGPIKIFNRIHAFVPIPAGDLNRIWFESGNKDLNYKIKFVDMRQGYKEYEIRVGNPSLDLKLPPGFNWTTSRTGTCETTVDYTAALGNYFPASQMTLADRLKYTWENIVYFFAGLSWPENHVTKDAKNGIYSQIFESVRFIWLPITLIIAALAIRQKRLNLMTLLFFGSLSFFLFQQSVITEARYKKPWEGVAIATLLTLFTKPSSRKKNEDAESES